MRSLAGRTILVTRAEDDSREWSDRLEALGARVVVYPCVSFETLDSAATTERLRKALSRADWLVLTSRRGVRAVAELMGSRLAPELRIAAVGPATAREAGDLLGPVQLTAAGGSGRALAKELLQEVRIGAPGPAPIVAVAASDRALRHLEEILVPEGVAVVRVPVYRTRPEPFRRSPDDLAELGVDTILLASPSAVEGLLNRAVIPPRASLVAIGSSTARAVRERGLAVTGQAARPDFESLVEAIP